MDRVSAVGYATVGGKRMFQNQDLATNTPGTDFEEVWFNGVQESIILAVEAAGLIPTDTDNTQLLQAMQMATSQFAADTGAANAYVVALTPALTAHVVGMPIRVKIAHTNTGASTFNPGPGAVAIQRMGLPLQKGDLFAGQIALLVYDGTVYRLLNPTPVIARGALLTLGTTQSIPNSVETAISWPSAIYDTDACSSGSGFTIPSGVSLVRFTGQVTFNANSTGARKMRVLKNGTIEGSGLFSSRVGTPDAADVTILSGAGSIVGVSPGDTLQLLVNQTSGGALNINSINTWFAMEILR